jgi:predicted Zn-dependent peptidase
MTLCVAGNVDPERVKEVAEKYFTLKKNECISPDPVTEEKGVSNKRVYKKLAVSKPLFGIAVKSEVEKLTVEERRKNDIAVAVALELIAGGISEFYNRLYSENVITDFSYEYMSSLSYGTVILTGVSSESERVYKEFFDSARKLTENGIPENDFETVKKNVYGKYLAGFDSIEDVANMALTAEFNGGNVFEPLEILKNLTADDVLLAIKFSLNEENASMAVIMPQDE